MEWKTVKLGDISVGGKGFYGIGAPAVEYDSNKYTYLRITDINDDGTLNKDGLKSVDDPDAPKYILQENDIVFARTGASTGRTYFFNPKDGALVYAGFLIKFSIDPAKANPQILKYITHSQEYYDWVHSFDTGGTRGNINAATFANMPIQLPDRTSQDKIVSILSSLDDKIENNNRINRNLEAQAQALFKSWFVDFEPFGGTMPEDWREGTLGDICTIKYGKGLSKNLLTDEGYPVFGGNGVIGYYTKFLYEQPQILVSCRGAASGKIMESDPQSFVTSNSLVLEMERRDFYHYLKYLLLANPLYNYATGSAQPQITIDNIKDVKVLLPSIDVVNSISEKFAVMDELVRSLKRESQRLAALRDTLLPKLMKGEIAV